MNIKVKNPNKFLDSVLFSQETRCYLYTLDGELYVEGADSKAHAEQLLSDHNPVDIYAVNATQKAALLARLGITADEAKLLIG